MKLRVPWDSAATMSGIPHGVMIVGKEDEKLPELLFENKERLEEAHDYAFRMVKYHGCISVNQFLTYLDFPDGGLWGVDHGWTSLPETPNAVKDYYMGAYRLVMPDPVELFKSRVEFKKPTFEEFKRDCVLHFEDNFQIDARKFILSYELTNGRVVTYCYTLNASECFTAFMHEVKPEDYYAPIYEDAYEKVLIEIDKLNEEGEQYALQESDQRSQFE